MTPNGLKGYYIDGISKGQGRITAGLFYGQPVFGELHPHIVVRPVEKAFSVARHNDFAELNSIYIEKIDTSKPNIFTEIEKQVIVPATPSLDKIFDEYILLWESDLIRYRAEVRESFRIGMEKAGLTNEDIPKDTETDTEQDKKEKDRIYTEIIFPKILSHMKIPEPVLVKVEGIEDILNNI